MNCFISRTSYTSCIIYIKNHLYFFSSKTEKAAAKPEKCCSRRYRELYYKYGAEAITRPKKATAEPDIKIVLLVVLRV